MDLVELPCPFRQYQIIFIGTPQNAPELEGVMNDAKEGPKMLRLLETVAELGRPANPNKCKHLKGKIWEFKCGPKRGPKMRLLHFRDGSRFVCCILLPAKRDDDLRSDINRANDIRDEYFCAKKSGSIVVHKDPAATT